MGRYLDLAADVIAELGTVSQYEINELNEISPLRAPGLGYEINELNEITPQGETWGAAAASTKIVLLHCPPGVPGAWVQGVADLLAMPCPASCPEERWNVLREDSYTFLRDHAAQAHELGWVALDLFGVHPVKPWSRPDAMGLVPMLQGRRITALSESRAEFRDHGGGELTYRRERAARPAEACLVWELAK